MKRKKVSFVLLSVLIMTSLLGIFSIEGLGSTNDLIYTFSNDNLYNSTSIDDDLEYFNSKNQTLYTGHYNATYSFENEQGLEDTNIPFIDISSGAYELSIISSLNGHDEVLLYNSTGASNNFKNNFDYLITGTIEYWILISEVSTNYWEFYLHGDNGGAVWFLFDDANQIRARDGAGFTTIYNYIDGVWFHLKIEFDCINDIYDVYINGMLEGDDFDFMNLQTTMRQFHFGGYNIDAGNYAGFDAIGYSWDGYNGTYTFTDEQIGETDLDIEWVNDIDRDGLMTMENNIGEHYRIMKIETTLASGGFNSIYWEDITEGFIELFVYIEDATDQALMYVLGGGGGTLNIQILNEYFQFREFGAGFVNFANALDDTWYHLRYQWYSNNTFDFYLNQTKELYNKLLYVNMTTGLDHFFCRVYGNPVYIDGVGYLWDPYYNIGDNLIHYSVGDNIIPYSITNTSITEVDAYSFSFTEGGVLTTGQTTIPFWNEILGGNLDEEITDGKLRLSSDNTDDIGVNKSNFNILDGIIDVNWNINYFNMDVVGGLLYINIYSSDFTLKTKLRYHIWGTAPNLISTFSYYDGSTYNNITTLAERTDYNYSLTIVNEIVVLKNASGILESFGTLTSNKGLGRIEFIANGGASANPPDDIQIITFDYIGVYSNGSSISEDHMSIDINMNEDWDSNIHNLFTSKIIGNCSISASDSISPNTKTLYTTYEFNETKILNVWDSFTGLDVGLDPLYLRECYLTLVSNNTLIIEYISIDGVRLNEGSNQYTPNFIFTSVDNNDSYFYVRENRLYFNLKTDDSNLESIQVSFDIEDVLTENRSIGFGSDLNGGASGYVRANYTDDSSTFLSVPSHATNTRLLLPQEKEIATLVIIISDLDALSSGSTNGYFSMIELLYFPDAVFTLTTLTILEVMIPLMILLIPTFAMYKKFGEHAIIPMFILMSIVCFIADLIPLWLFFIMLFGSGVMFFGKNKLEAF